MNDASADITERHYTRDDETTKPRALVDQYTYLYDIYIIVKHARIRLLYVAYFCHVRAIAYTT